MTINHKNKLDRFAVKMAVRGIHEEKDPQAQQEFEYELSMRPHILDHSVKLDQENHQLIVQLVTEGIGLEMTANQMAEELLEIGYALLNEIEGAQILILGVEQI